MSERIRSFIAIDIDDELLLNRLVELQQTLVNTGANLKLVEKENLHFTLRFLGENPATAINNICDEMKKVSFKPLNLHMKGVGVFPNINRINVVWTGIVEGKEEIRALFNQIESRLSALGFPHDPKGFSPHLTIARVKTGKNKDKLAKSVTELSDHEVGNMTVNYVRLKRSILTPKGPNYSTIYKISA
ncbi:MAG: RNA 2',3'-cyclic phosphodiesterase [Candidatus Bathyarchaeota archaeon]